MNAERQWNPTFRYFIGILCLAAIVAFLFYAHEAVKNLIIAAFTAYLINPAVVYLVARTRMPRGRAVNIVYFSALILMIGLPAIFTPIFFDEAKLVFEDLLDLVRQMSEALAQPVVIGKISFHFEQLGKNLAELQNVILAPILEEPLRALETTSLGVLWLLVILVSVHLFLYHWPSMREGLINLAPPEYHEEINDLYRRIQRVWMAYLRGQIVLMMIVGVVFTVAWFVIGIPGALALGVIAGFFTLIPDVGPFLAAALAVGVALLEGSSWIPLSKFWVAGIVALTYLVLINLKNFFLRPYIMGRSVHMNEALVFIAIMIATILEGILGALLVVPVLASLILIGEYLRRRVLGLSPFEDDGETKFAAPPEKTNPRIKFKPPEKQEPTG